MVMKAVKMVSNVRWNVCVRLTFLLITVTGVESQIFKRICYFTNWSCDLLVPEAHFCLDDIDPNLCSHIIYGFVNINVTSYSLTPSRVDDESKDTFVGRYVLFNNLKNHHPHVKTLLSVGGSKMSQDFNSVTATATSRKRFAANCVDYVRKWGFDGLDLDWEYPGQSGGHKEALSCLVQELRKADEELTVGSNASPIILSVAGPASDSLVDQGFEVDIISKHVDFINLMAYDLQGAWSDITGFNSPLFPRKGDWRFHPKHCVEWVVKMWLDKGAPPSKLVLGIAGYGQSYTLKPNSTTSTTSSRSLDVAFTGVSQTITLPTSQTRSLPVTVNRVSDDVQDSSIHLTTNQTTNSRAEELDMSTVINGGNDIPFRAASEVIPDLRKTITTPSLSIPGIGSRAFGPGRPGRLRHLKGQLSFPEICEFIDNGGHVVWDQEQRVPFMTSEDLWVGYDDVRSVVEKVTWAVSQNLGGIMFWSLDLDDFSGKYCHKGKYPLLTAISHTVMSLDNLKNEVDRREMAEAGYQIRRGRQRNLVTKEGELLKSQVSGDETDNLRPHYSIQENNFHEEDNLLHHQPTPNQQIVLNSPTQMVGDGPGRNPPTEKRATRHYVERNGRSHHFANVNHRNTINAHNSRQSNKNTSRNGSGNERGQQRTKYMKDRHFHGPENLRHYHNGNNLANKGLETPERNFRRRLENHVNSAAITIHPRRSAISSRFDSRRSNPSEQGRYDGSNHLILSDMNKNLNGIENINDDRYNALHSRDVYSGDPNSTKMPISGIRRHHPGGQNTGNNNFIHSSRHRNNIGNTRLGGIRHSFLNSFNNGNGGPGNPSLDYPLHRNKPVINKTDSIGSDRAGFEDSVVIDEQKDPSGVNGFRAKPLFMDNEQSPDQHRYQPNQHFTSSPSRMSSISSSLRPATLSLTPAITDDYFEENLNDFVDNSLLDEVVNEYDYYIAFVNDLQSPPDTTIPPHDAFTYARQSSSDSHGDEAWTKRQNSGIQLNQEENYKEDPNSSLVDNQTTTVAKAASGKEEKVASNFEGGGQNDRRKHFYATNSGHSHRVVMVYGFDVLICNILLVGMLLRSL